MSELREQERSVAETQADVPITAGKLLKAAREAAGLHIAALAVSLKVPVKKLEALEADRLDLLPDAVFSRALAATVCRTLKIDPAPILSKLPSTATVSLKPVDDGINAPFREAREVPSLDVKRLFSRPGPMFAALLLVAALVMVFAPSFDKAVSTVPVSTATSLDPTAVPGLPADPASALPSAMPSPLPVGPGSASILAVPAPEVSAVSGSLPGMPAPASVVPPGGGVEAAPVNVLEAADSILVIKAKAPSWVQVIDAKGVTQLNRTLQPDEVIAVSGALPLSAVVGRADSTEVQIRGKPMDLTPLTKSNVARFEVK